MSLVNLVLRLDIVLCCVKVSWLSVLVIISGVWFYLRWVCLSCCMMYLVSNMKLVHDMLSLRI